MKPPTCMGIPFDLVITRCEELSISNLCVQAPIPSDHVAVCFSLPPEQPPQIHKTRAFRKLKYIDIEEVQKDILRQSSPYTAPAVNDQYHSVLKDILDPHAPEKTKKVTVMVHPPYFTDNIRETKKAR